MGNINGINLGQTEAEERIVKFGRDRQNPPTITIMENGEYDVRNYIRAVVNVDANVNRVEYSDGVVTQLDLPDWLVSGLINGNASAIINVNLTALQAGFGWVPLPLQYLDGTIMAGLAAVADDLESSGALSFVWGQDGAFISAGAILNGQVRDLSPAAALIGYSLQSYYHPMP